MALDSENGNDSDDAEMENDSNGAEMENRENSSDGSGVNKVCEVGLRVHETESDQADDE